MTIGTTHKIDTAIMATTTKEKNGLIKEAKKVKKTYKGDREGTK